MIKWEDHVSHYGKNHQAVVQFTDLFLFSCKINIGFRKIAGTNLPTVVTMEQLHPSKVDVEFGTVLYTVSHDN